MTDITMDIEAICNECGSDLEIEEGSRGVGSYRPSAKIVVFPCEKCLESAREDERDKAEHAE